MAGDNTVCKTPATHQTTPASWGRAPRRGVPSRARPCGWVRPARESLCGTAGQGLKQATCRHGAIEFSCGGKASQIIGSVGCYARLIRGTSFGGLRGLCFDPSDPRQKTSHPVRAGAASVNLYLGRPSPSRDLPKVLNLFWPPLTLFASRRMVIAMSEDKGG